MWFTLHHQISNEMNKWMNTRFIQQLVYSKFHNLALSGQLLVGVFSHSMQVLNPFSRDAITKYPKCVLEHQKCTDS